MLQLSKRHCFLRTNPKDECLEYEHHKDNARFLLRSVGFIERTTTSMKANSWRPPLYKLIITSQLVSCHVRQKYLIEMQMNIKNFCCHVAWLCTWITIFYADSIDQWKKAVYYHNISFSLNSIYSDLMTYEICFSSQCLTNSSAPNTKYHKRK